MICPKCRSDTRVKDSRPHREDARVIVRRRACDGCGHRFATQEGTIDIVARRKSVRAAEKARRQARPEWARAVDTERTKRRAILKIAQQEAAESGKPVEEVMRAWKVAPAAVPASPNP